MIELRVSEPDPIVLEAEEQDQASLAVLEAFVSGGDIPAYTGSYNVTPTQSQQTLETNGKKMVRDVKVAPIPSQYIIPEGTLEVTQNGQQSVREYENVNVAVPTVTPTGEKTINVTQNGTTTEDVTNYATAKVVTNVPASAVDSGTKNINANGTHDVVGYASAAVNVPNSYSASDEGKVVQSGALVAQTSDTVTQNGTVDTTLIDELTVDVSGGGGGATVIASGTFTGNGTQTATFPIGNKMAKTDFIVEVYASRGAEFPYNTDQKIIEAGAHCDSRFTYYDLSADGTVEPTFQDDSYIYYNQSGTLKKLASRPVFGSAHYLKSGTGANVQGIAWASPTITRASSGFSITLAFISGYKYLSGMTYNFVVFYIGSTPATDIVEVP